MVNNNDEQRPRAIPYYGYKGLLEENKALRASLETSKVELDELEVQMPLAKQRSFFAGAIAAILLVATLTGGAIGIGSIFENKNKREIINEQISSYKEIVNDSITIKLKDGELILMHTDSQIESLALKLMEEPDNFDKNLYILFKNLTDHYNPASAIGTLNRIIEAYNRLAPQYGISPRPYETFHKYCEAKGYIKEDGTIDIDKFEKDIETIILVEDAIREQQKLKDELINKTKTM